MFGLVIFTSPWSLHPSWVREQTNALSIVWQYLANTEAEPYRQDTRLKRQTLNAALGKFNISIVSTDSSTIKHKANKVYTNLTIETDGLTYIQKRFMSSLINALETQICHIHLSGTASKWSVNGGASLWLHCAQTHCVSRLTVWSGAQKLQGPVSVTGPSPANGSHNH